MGQRLQAGFRAGRRFGDHPLEGGKGRLDVAGPGADGRALEQAQEVRRIEPRRFLEIGFGAGRAQDMSDRCQVAIGRRGGLATERVVAGAFRRVGGDGAEDRFGLAGLARLYKRERRGVSRIVSVVRRQAPNRRRHGVGLFQRGVERIDEACRECEGDRRRKQPVAGWMLGCDRFHRMRSVSQG